MPALAYAEEPDMPRARPRPANRSRTALWTAITGQHRTPEERLQIGVLIQAGLDLSWPPERGKSREHFLRDLRRWLASDCTDYAYNFVSCCAAADLDPAAVRHALATRTINWAALFSAADE